MIVLLTDFGLEGPYIGQVKAVLLREAPAIPIVDLFSDLPVFDAQGAAYLLAAYGVQFPPGSVFVAVVDPGVGGNRAGLVMQADGRWYVGPDNGLLAVAARRAADAQWWEITWKPERLSSSFHGRDIFAPVAAALGRGEDVPGVPVEGVQRVGVDWPDDLFRIVYIDRFGNAVTGVRATDIDADAVVHIAGRALSRAHTFSAVARGEGFWYENANGLLEIAVNQGRADRDLGLALGATVEILPAHRTAAP